MTIIISTNGQVEIPDNIGVGKCITTGYDRAILTGVLGVLYLQFLRAERFHFPLQFDTRLSPTLASAFPLNWADIAIYPLFSLDIVYGISQFWEQSTYGNKCIRDSSRKTPGDNPLLDRTPATE